VWKDALLAGSNFDANGNQLVWVRSEAKGRRAPPRPSPRSSASAQTPALSSKFGLVTGRMNSEISNTLGTVVTGGLVGRRDVPRCSAPLPSSPPIPTRPRRPPRRPA